MKKELILLRKANEVIEKYDKKIIKEIKLIDDTIRKLEKEKLRLASKLCKDGK